MEALRARTIYSPELTSNGRSTRPPGPFFSLWPFHPLCAAPSWPATLPTSGALGRTHIMKKGPAHCTFQLLMGSAAELRSITTTNILAILCARSGAKIFSGLNNLDTCRRGPRLNRCCSQGSTHLVGCISIPPPRPAVRQYNAFTMHICTSRPSSGYDEPSAPTASPSGSASGRFYNRGEVDDVECLQTGWALDYSDQPALRKPSSMCSKSFNPNHGGR